MRALARGKAASGAGHDAGPLTLLPGESENVTVLRASAATLRTLVVQPPPESDALRSVYFCPGSAWCTLTIVLSRDGASISIRMMCCCRSAVKAPSMTPAFAQRFIQA